MKNILRLVRWMFMLATAALAVPSFAATNGSKFFTLNVSPIAGGLQAVITNANPPGTNATINSVDLFVDLGWTLTPIKVYEANAPTVFYTANAGNPKNNPPTHIKVANLASIKPGNSLVIQFSVAASNTGDATFNAIVYAGNSFTGNQFTQVGGQNVGSFPTDSLACAPSTPPTPTAGSVIAMRGDFNKDGTSGNTGSCGAAAIFATQTLGGNSTTGLPPNLLHFRWEKSGGTDGSDFATAAFEYLLYYTNGTAPTLPIKEGWLRANGDLAVDPGANPNVDSAIFGANNPVVFINAPSCDVLPGQLPAPYAKLTVDPGASSSGTQQDITIDTTGYSPPASPGFPIYVGLERMQVTQFVDSTHWTVLRDTLGTGAPAHPVDTLAGTPLVMSTPLPILSAADVQTAYVMLADGSFQTTTAAGVSNPYLANTQAQACFAGTGVDNTVSPPLQYNSFIDIGDQWVPVR